MVIVFDILKFLLLVLATFLTCEVITNKNKRISYIGTLLVCFSTAVLQYINQGIIEAIAFSEIIFLSIDRMLEKQEYKLIYSLCIRNYRVFDIFKYKFSNINWNNFFNSNFMESFEIF